MKTVQRHLPVLEATSISKRYQLGVTGARTLGDEIKRTWGRLTGAPDPLATVDLARPRTDGKEFWALRDISFTLNEGEVLGIIGRNGAGKSTLLKLFSRITTPTSGRIRLRGTMSSLLEIGTGFNPELTGLENIYLNAAILGMKKAEIDRKLSDIISFSGIEHHIDTPVKRYSSGMKVRLGFSVAAHLDPDIMVIDEVLAVGDAEFQRKCLGKMKDVSDGGRTVIFVSHNMTAIRALCSRVIWLHAGRVHMDGPTEEVVRAYLMSHSRPEANRRWEQDKAPGTAELRLVGVGVEQADPTQPLTTVDGFHFVIDLVNLGVDDGDLNVSLYVHNNEDILAFSTSWREGSMGNERLERGLRRFRCHVPPDLLNIGEYRVTVNVFRRGTLSFNLEDSISFEVNEPKREGNWYGRRKGVFIPRLQWALT
ncbi:MAG TPA: polysaccharide ABC transporter ATP-binding protein [Flavobacteriales bacterium]